MASIPNDPVILLSYINTQLRDNYPSLPELCDALSIEPDVLAQKLSGIGYEYDKTQNQFI